MCICPDPSCTCGAAIRQPTTPDPFIHQREHWGQVLYPLVMALVSGVTIGSLIVVALFR